jgi:hypothetical protein
VKELLIRLMALFGLVPARRYHSLARQFDETRRSAHTWKARAGEALGRVKSLEGEVERQSRLLKEATSQSEKRDEAEAEATSLRDQFAATQKELILAREQLMAIEVKLDILEGAANVLDSRTRAVVRQPAETSARV